MVLKRRIIFHFFATQMPVGGNNFALCVLSGFSTFTAGVRRRVTSPPGRRRHRARTESRGSAYVRGLPGKRILAFTFEINFADPLGARSASRGRLAGGYPKNHVLRGFDVS